MLPAPMRPIFLRVGIALSSLLEGPRVYHSSRGAEPVEVVRPPEAEQGKADADVDRADVMPPARGDEESLARREDDLVERHSEVVALGIACGIETARTDEES